MVFDKSVSDPANITISEDSDFLYRLITSGFYRVLCKSAMGGGEVFVCRLKDNDSNFYIDGSPAVLTGQEGDVMVVFLEFWYKWYKVDDNRFLYHFADHDIDGTYIHVPASLEHIKDMCLQIDYIAGVMLLLRRTYHYLISEVTQKHVVPVSR